MSRWVLPVLVFCQVNWIIIGVLYGSTRGRDEVEK